MKQSLPLLCAGLVGLSAGLNAQESLGPVKFAFAYPGTAVVDGVAEALWDKAPANSIANPLRNGGAPVDGANCTATFQALYDNNFLYVLVKVTDDKLQPEAAEESAEVFIDGDYSRLFGVAWNAGGQDGYNDYQFAFGSDNRDITTGLHSAPGWTQPGEGDYPMAVEYKAKVTGNSYVLEAKFGLEGFNYTESGGFDFKALPVLPGAEMPLESVNDSNFAAYRHIGLEVQVSDSDTDDGKKNFKLGWANSATLYADPENSDGDTAWYNTATFGTLIFWDGVPPPASTNPFASLKSGAWSFVENQGWHFGSQDGAGWSYSLVMTTYVYSTSYPWLYHSNLGYIYYSGGDIKDGAVYYSSALGAYIWMSEAYGAWAFNYSTNGWVNTLAALP